MSTVSDHLANERTFLAYVRTSIALISFGVTLNRFSKFLISEQQSPSEVRPRLFLGQAGKVGLGMAIFGIALLIWAALRSSRISGEIDRGTYKPDRASFWFLTVGVLGLGGVGLVWLLVSS